MKKTYRSMAGITLLELMLVLAIAGVVIAMSVKYYQQAATNQRIAAGMGVVSSVVAAVESYRLTGAAIDSKMTESTLQKYFSNGKPPVSPWDNSAVTVKGTSGTEYTIDIATTDANTCQIFAEQVSGQQGFKATCGTGTTAKITVGEATSTPTP